ncbi:MAG: hypothetical protein IKB42_01940 [Clostridia bacterium]|nr:hypothetical protein [Clostridia bacterium]
MFTEKNVANHDKYRYDGNSVVHKVEAALRNLPLMKNYPNAEKTISQFTDAISMNNKVINMHAGNASVDDVELIKACKNCKTPSDLSKVLRSLTAQVNAARLNSALSQVYDIANRIGKNTIPNDVDKSIENAITNIYNRCMNGDPKRKLKPIEIPSNPNEPFAAPDLIFKLCEKVKDKKGLTPQQVYKELVAPCETTVNKVIEAQKNKQLKRTTIVVLFFVVLNRLKNQIIYKQIFIKIYKLYINSFANFSTKSI